MADPGSRSILAALGTLAAAALLLYPTLAHVATASGDCHAYCPIPADTTPPALTVPSVVAVPATRANGADVTFSASAFDDRDGPVPASCAPASGSAFGLGETRDACTAHDAAGNAASASFPVRVTFAWSGFKHPEQANETRKIGNALVVDFSLAGASRNVRSTAFTLWTARTSNGVAQPENAAVSRNDAEPGNHFVYHANGNDPQSQDAGYQFHWDTRGLAPATYRLRADLGDGVARVTYVKLKP